MCLLSLLRQFLPVFTMMVLCPTLARGADRPDLKSADYYVFLVAGQSNAQGWLGEKNEGLNEPIPVPEQGTVFYFDEKAGEIRDVVGADPEVYVGNKAGFHNRFAIDYHKATGKKVLFVHEVHGNSGVVPGVAYGGGNWPDTYRAALKRKYEAFKGAAVSSPSAGKWALAGLIWGQGEAECFLFEKKQKTIGEVKSALSALFDGFVQDYGPDYSGKPDKLIKVLLVSVFACPGLKSDKFYPDSPEWAMTRDVQRDVAEKHPDARMVYFATEKIFNEGVWPNNAVHYFQKQYNEIGRVMAAEIAHSGSTIHRSAAPLDLSATADGAWRVRLNWAPPKGGVPGDLPNYRIYRRTKGQGDWEWIYQWQGSDAPVKGFVDETGIQPGTSYEYRVSARNEFGEEFSDVVEVTVPPLAADMLDAYQKAASVKDVTAIKILWAALEAGGHTKGMRALILMRADGNAPKSDVCNFIRGQDLIDRFDFTTQDEGVVREKTGFVFSAPAELTTAGALLPVNGPFTLMMDLGFEKLPVGRDGLAFMTQGHGYPPPPQNSRTLFSIKGDTKEMDFYHEDQVGSIKFGGGPFAEGRQETLAITYASPELTLLRAGSPSVTHGNTIHFFNIMDTPFTIRLGPYSGEPPVIRISYLAVWNRALSSDEFDAVSKIVQRYLGTKL